LLCLCTWRALWSIAWSACSFYHSWPVRWIRSQKQMQIVRWQNIVKLHHHSGTPSYSRYSASLAPSLGLLGKIARVWTSMMKDRYILLADILFATWLKVYLYLGINKNMSLKIDIAWNRLPVLFLHIFLLVCVCARRCLQDFGLCRT